MPFIKINDLGRFGTHRTMLAETKGVVGEISPLQCAGMNRYEVEDERALRERSVERVQRQIVTGVVGISA
jgi:hypothetical protein